MTAQESYIEQLQAMVSALQIENRRLRKKNKKLSRVDIIEVKDLKPLDKYPLSALPIKETNYQS